MISNHRPSILYISNSHVKVQGLYLAHLVLIQTLGASCKTKDLANETLLNIFDYLDRKDLRAVRLVCHQFLHAGDMALNQVVYFSPRRRSMQAFSNISQHEFFKSTVKHVIYDDTQLIEDLTNSKVFDAALPAGFPRVEARRALDRYCQLFDEQESILHNGEDIVVLSKALVCFPNLKKISVTGGPSRHPRGATYFLEGAQAQRFANTIYGLSYWSYNDSDKERYRTWDRRPFHHLLKALDLAKVQLEDLHIGNTSNFIPGEPVKMGLPLSSLRTIHFFERRTFLTACKNAFAHLTSLDLRLDVHGRTSHHEYYGDMNTYGDMNDLFRILPFTKQLKSLSLGFTEFCLHPRDTLSVLVNRWPSLQSVKFYNMDAAMEDLLGFVDNHKGTMHNLILHDFGLKPGSIQSWMQFAKSARVFLRFAFADMRVYELVGDDEVLYQWGRPIVSELTH